MDSRDTGRSTNSIEQERFLSMKLRGLLGEDLFWQIANKNPNRWLQVEWRAAFGLPDYFTALSLTLRRDFLRLTVPL